MAAPQFPNPLDDGLHWYYNLNHGQIEHVTNFFKRQYYNSLTSEWIRFKTQAEAEAYKAAHPPTHQSQFNPLNPNNPTHNLISGAGNAAGDVLNNAAQGLGDALGLGALFQANIWLRVGEGIVGLMLIGLGVAALTRNTAAGNAIRSGVRYIK